MQVYRPSFKYDVPANPKGKVVRAAKRRSHPIHTLTIPKHRLEFLTDCLKAIEWQSKNLSDKNQVLLPKNLGEVRKLLASIIEEARTQSARSVALTTFINRNKKATAKYDLEAWKDLDARMDVMTARELNAWRIRMNREGKEAWRAKRAAKIAA